MAADLKSKAAVFDFAVQFQTDPYKMPIEDPGITWDESIWWPRLGRNMRTTAEALHDDGYFTAGMFSFNYFAIADHRGFERGMDLYRSDRAVLHVAVNGPMESQGSSSRSCSARTVQTSRGGSACSPRWRRRA